MHIDYTGVLDVLIAHHGFKNVVTNVLRLPVDEICSLWRKAVKEWSKADRANLAEERRVDEAPRASISQA